MSSKVQCANNKYHENTEIPGEDTMLVTSNDTDTKVKIAL